MKKIPHGFSTVISPLFTGRLEAALYGLLDKDGFRLSGYIR